MFKGDFFFSISYQDFAKGDVDKTNCGSREEEKKRHLDCFQWGKKNKIYQSLID